MGTPSDQTADLPARVAQWIAGGETYEVEFKGEQRERLNDRDLVEAVVCLANGTGGVLLVGVEDDGSVSGARPRHEAGRTDPLRVQALIANMTQPALSAVAGIVQIEGAEVLVLEVPDSPRVVGTTRGTYVRRAIAGDGRPTCVPYHAHEMLAHEVDRGAVDWAGLRIGGATWADLDPLEFERLRRLTATAGDRADRLLASLSDREIANALGLIRTEAEVTAGTSCFSGVLRRCGASCPLTRRPSRSSEGLRSKSTIFCRTPCCGSPRRCSHASRPGTRRKSCSSGCFAWRYQATPRPHSVRRSPTRSSTGTTHSGCCPCAVERGSAGDLQPWGLSKRHTAGQPARRAAASTQPAACGCVQAHRPRRTNRARDQPDVRGAAAGRAASTRLREKLRRPCCCCPAGWAGQPVHDEVGP